MAFAAIETASGNGTALSLCLDGTNEQQKASQIVQECQSAFKLIRPNP
jgi:hypothetical protein